MKLEPSDKHNSDTPRGVSFFWLIPLCLMVALGGVVYKLYETEQPRITLGQDVTWFGVAKRLSVSVADAKSGVRSLRVVLRQGNHEAVLLQREYPGSGFVFVAGPHQITEDFVVNTPALKFVDGPAQLEIAARDFSWWGWRQGNLARIFSTVTIDSKPPRLEVSFAPTTIKTGSSGVVVYRASEPVQKSGVVVNGDFHPGFPLPRYGEQAYGALIGIRFDADQAKVQEAYVTGTDQAGNEGRAALGMSIRRSVQRSDRINLNGSFLDSKLPEFVSHYPDLKGTPLEKYLELNTRVRLENNHRIAEVTAASTPERYWQGVFLRLPRSSHKAGYADHRTYYFEGREIDHQVHLGIDLASTQHATVEAANRGKVVFADYLGIYGNTVILDHGQGVYSLYSHLSRIDATVGDMVDKGGAVGLSGNTGMAGGDHLHFSVLVNGIFVNPVEWWDAHWLKLNVENYL